MSSVTVTHPNSAKGDFLSGLREGFPLTVSIFAYGLVFGVLARQAGLTYMEALLMSAVVFAGSSQFAAVAMISTGMGATQIITATLLLNLRHLLMGASLAPYLRDTKPWKLALLAHGLNDESYALTISRFQRYGGSASYFLAAGIATFTGWFGSTVVAASAGNFLGDPKRLGLDFAFYGVFIGLLVPQLKDRPTVAAAVASALTAVLTAKFLPGNWYIILAALTAVAAGVVIESAG
ncbi:MAG: AzlC family ABC transporter permease [Bacillota bacterium]|nr:AzlC family ABC transporter permease [Bacillota bacterium]